MRTQRPSSRLRTAGLTPYTRRVRTVVIIGALLTTPVLADARTTLEVFTTHTRPLALDTLPHAAALEVTVYTLDDIERLNTQLSMDLDATPDTAQAQVKRRLSQLDSTQINALQSTSRGLAIAAELGLEKLPAWIFDRRAVVYGVRDATVAWHAYQRWRVRAP